MRADNLPAQRLSKSNFTDSYWTIAQLLAHHTVSGCNLKPGDLLGSGTMSGAQAGSEGALLAQGFQNNMGKPAAAEKVLGADEAITDKLLQELLQTKQPDALLLWLENDDMGKVTEWLTRQAQHPEHVFASWSLLEGKASAIPDQLREKFFLT